MTKNAPAPASRPRPDVINPRMATPPPNWQPVSGNPGVQYNPNAVEGIPQAGFSRLRRSGGMF
jgi:hypothetical protein